jgi:hypothetical protein
MDFGKLLAFLSAIRFRFSNSRGKIDKISFSIYLKLIDHDNVNYFYKNVVAKFFRANFEGTSILNSKKYYNIIYDGAQLPNIQRVYYVVCKPNLHLLQ